MRVCDRCGGTVTKHSYVRAADDGQIDLCPACDDAFRKFIVEYGTTKTLRHRRGGKDGPGTQRDAGRTS